MVGMLDSSVGIGQNICIRRSGKLLPQQIW
jgi:hypothetical protein